MSAHHHDCRTSNSSIRWAIVCLATGLVAACGSSGAGVTIERSDRSAAEPGASAATTPETAATDPPMTTEPTQPADPTPPTDPTQPADPAQPTDPPPDTADDAPANGTSGVGDSLFPDLGNPGIDVTHYDIDLAYDPASAKIEATVTLSIAATAQLDEFTLDQIGLVVDAVRLDDALVAFELADPEMIITPSSPIAVGTNFTVAVTYSADGSQSRSAAGVSSGWFPTPLGSFTLNEPDGARTWLPSNDHPSDKASYRFSIAVPDGYTAVANGSLVSSEPADEGGSVWVWEQSEPMTTYVIQVLTGPYTIVSSETAAGLPLISAIFDGDDALMQPFLDVTPLQIEFFEQYFGPYPLDRYGIAMTDVYFGGAMEEQGRSLFSREDFRSGELGYGEELLLSHELGHQWFGNAVAPARWRDIWLNESFASYAEWMWLDHAGYLDLEETAASNLELRQDGYVATGDPDVAGLFGYEVYEGGAVVLHALRRTVGEDVFFEILQTWVANNVDTSRTTDDFIATAERVSTMDLTDFFAEWLEATDLPDEFPG